MLIRQALSTDVEPLVALIQSAYRGDASRAGWTTEAHLLEGQRTDQEAVRALVGAGSMLLGIDDADADPDSDGVPAGPPGGVRDADAAILGCCQVELRGEVAYFGTFAVRPTGQGGGTGSALLAEAERRARAGGCRVMEMTVLAQRTDLIPYYERRGYVRTGEDRPFPYGNERYGKPQREDLVFTVLAKDL